MGSILRLAPVGTALLAPVDTALLAPVRKGCIALALDSSRLWGLVGLAAADLGIDLAHTDLENIVKRKGLALDLGPLGIHTHTHLGILHCYQPIVAAARVRHTLETLPHHFLPAIVVAVPGIQPMRNRIGSQGTPIDFESQCHRHVGPCRSKRSNIKHYLKSDKSNRYHSSYGRNIITL